MNTLTEEYHAILGDWRDEAAIEREKKVMVLCREAKVRSRGTSWFEIEVRGVFREVDVSYLPSGREARDEVNRAVRNLAERIVDSVTHNR